MSYLQRKMFANGGGVNVAPNQVVVGNETFTIDLNRFEQAVREGLLDGTDLYPIINAPGAQRGSEIQRILNEFARVDEPGIYPNRIAANIMGVAPEDRPDSQLYEPGDFGSAAQDVGLMLQRYGQSVRNVAARGGNLAAKGLGGIADYLTGPDIAGAFGGLRAREAAIQRQAEGQSYMPEGDIFSEVPLMTQDDVARIRLGQMGDIVSLSDTIDQDIEEITEEKSIEEMPKGIVEIRNIGPDEDIDSILEKIKPIDINKTEQESADDVEKKFEGLEEKGLKEITEDMFESIRPGEDPTKPRLFSDTLKTIEDYIPGDYIEGLDTPPPPKTKGDGLIKDTDGDPVSRKLDEPGFFGSDRFLNFIRNVGGELVRTGQMGAGLASGAAKAAEERAARELLADQERRKYEKEIELARAKADATGADIMKPEKILDLNNNVRRDITDFQGGIAGVGFVDYAIDIIEEAMENDEPVGGAEGFFMKMVDKGFAFVGMSQDFDEMSADSKVAELTKVVKQKNLQAILGESGRTISDRDRQIIETVFGDLGAFENPSTTLGKLKQSRQQLAQSANERYQNILTNSSFLGRQGAEGLNFYSRLLPSLQQILNIDPLANQSAIARARFAGGGLDTGIPEISL
tara:strand:- start:131 stop:2023 length:1893 start_codon:yes stop_codon:yes gene_type:complete